MSQENDLTVQAAILEALLFSSEEPLTTAKIREIAEELQEADIKGVTEHLNQKYDDTGRSFRIQMVAGGYQIFTLPDYAEYIEKLYAKRQQQRLSAKALETLAIIAYKQPITRPEIEDIRGVNVDGVLRTLLSRKLITISGTANAP
ncbi:MAG: SMC-Scp complex subunit ScpB, partial [Aliifodinibius sp.]|nr:SMC-Scp complex subunit ScpB [Fodinibius sp.]NIV16600.1 SMC-Scp complex subunit ScpB [Fodinibius sp.]NIY30584.1 SMC-Scp complex subunit ScpB [Fodinibius sp.]